MDTEVTAARRPFEIRHSQPHRGRKKDGEIDIEIRLSGDKCFRTFSLSWPRDADADDDADDDDDVIVICLRPLQ